MKPFLKTSKFKSSTFPIVITLKKLQETFDASSHHFEESPSITQVLIDAFLHRLDVLLHRSLGCTSLFFLLR